MKRMQIEKANPGYLKVLDKIAKENMIKEEEKRKQDEIMKAEKAKIAAEKAAEKAA
jgi:hypothetical protein